MDSQYCEDNIIEKVGSQSLVVGVFDGHGGHQCSRVASGRLVASVAQLMTPENALSSDSLVSVFRRVDEDWCTGSNSDESGTTATLGMIQGQRLTIAHVGDTRAMTIKKDGSCEVLTTCHRASNDVERQRILARGGDVPECSKGECARVNGLIEVTRSLGDRWLKPVLDCTPEVVARDLTPEDAFLVIGSDGLFDCVDIATVASFVTKEAHKGVSQCEIAFSLAKMAYRNGSTDDISAYVLSLGSKERQMLSDDAQVSVPCSNGGTVHSEPALAPQTPAQHKSLDGSIFTPQSNGHLDEAPTTDPKGAGDEHASPWWRSVAWRSIQFGTCALAVAGLVVLAGRRRRG